MKKVLLVIILLISFPFCASSNDLDFYISNLKQLDLSHDTFYDPPVDLNDDYWIELFKERAEFGSYNVSANNEIHYLIYCANMHKGLATLFTINNNKPELVYKKFDLGCVQNPRVEDIDDDGNNELIIESGGGGTGIYCKKEYLFFSQDISSPINYFKECEETSPLNFMFSSSDIERISEELETDIRRFSYTSEDNITMQKKDNEILLNKLIKISMSSILLDEFIKLNPSYPNGECSYEFGKIILGDKIELVEFPRGCLVNR